VAVVTGGVLVGAIFYRYHRQLERLVINLAARVNRRAPIDEEGA
jgi:hypothetical protein